MTSFTIDIADDGSPSARWSGMEIAPGDDVNAAVWHLLRAVEDTIIRQVPPRERGNCRKREARTAA